MGIAEIVALIETAAQLALRLSESGRTTATAEEEQELVDVLNRQKAEEEQWAKPE